MVGHSTGVRWRGIAVLLGATVLSALLAVGPVHGAGGGAPLAEAGLDQQVLEGETVRLDAAGSYDPDGRVVAHEWRVRTPDGWEVTPSDPRAARSSFRAVAVGRYEVTLTVTDGDGNTGTDTMYVVVEPGDGGDGTTGPDTGGSGPSGSTSGGGGTDTGGGTSLAACSDTAGSSGGCVTPQDAAVPGPAVGIEGPTVVEAERSYTYTARTSGLTGERTYDWEGGDTGRSHTLVFETGGAYTTRVAVEGARGRSAGAELEVIVEPVDNERPDVEIVDPGSISPGQRLTLSADADDPDGRVVSTSWSPGRRVTVPTDGSSRTVRVTVTDEDGASVTDSITLTGIGWNRTEVGVDTTDVTCYFTKDRHRDGRHPYSPRCVRENGEVVSLNVAASHIEEFRRNEKIDLHWRRTTESRLRGLRANDTSTDYGTAAESPHDEADTYGFSDDPVRSHTSARWASVDNVEAFTLNGRTVEDDLNGDGAVNAADWDQRYRTEGDTVNVDPHADAAEAFKHTIPGDGRPDGGGGGLASKPEATARTVEGAFAGTSIDAENRHDRVAEYSRRVSGAGDSDSGGAEQSGGSETSDTDRGGHDDGDTDSGSESGSDREVSDVNDRDDDNDGGGTHSSGGTGGDSGGSDADGRSRHSPQGGRIVGHI
ncbi:PKD domain-containing protein [Salinirubellus sp. GCM10025818]|uniref:PKD domain-containing protein n=1 Tax=Salinirubellus TaxID=2162630 RepID=UPI0030D46F37